MKTKRHQLSMDNLFKTLVSTPYNTYKLGQTKKNSLASKAVSDSGSSSIPERVSGTASRSIVPMIYSAIKNKSSPRTEFRADKSYESGASLPRYLGEPKLGHKSLLGIYPIYVNTRRIWSCINRGRACTK